MANMITYIPKKTIAKAYLHSTLRPLWQRVYAATWWMLHGHGMKVVPPLFKKEGRES